MEIALPVASSAAVTAMLAQEYNRRLQDGSLGSSQNMLNRVTEGAGRVAVSTPAATFMAGLAGTGLAANAASGLQKFILKAAGDSVKMAEVDLNGLSYWLGDQLMQLGVPGGTA